MEILQMDFTPFHSASLLTTQIDFSISLLNYNHSDKELFYSTRFSYAKTLTSIWLLNTIPVCIYQWWTEHREWNEHFRIDDKAYEGTATCDL